MKDKVVRSRSSSYGNSITTNLSTIQILSSLMNDVQTYGVVAGDDDNGSTPASIDNHSASSSSSALSRAKHESIDIEQPNNDKLTVYDLSDEDSDDDVDSPSSQNFSLPTSTSTVTTGKTSPSSAVRSIISTYIRDQPVTTPPPPKNLVVAAIEDIAVWVVLAVASAFSKGGPAIQAAIIMTFATSPLLYLVYGRLRPTETKQYIQMQKKTTEVSKPYDLDTNLIEDRQSKPFRKLRLETPSTSPNSSIRIHLKRLPKGQWRLCREIGSG
ncbi:unnamed protein product [Rotaria sp. Silwood1]|nr:unnamed protein product [Rotaria sp. Silwood1]CAF1136083.1 unnamed protein product [Rotaria sp. Silwood1]